MQPVIFGGLKRVLHYTSRKLKSEKEMNVAALHEAKKLVLVLDIDHTIIHATADERAAEFAGHSTLGMDIHDFDLHPGPRHPNIAPRKHWIKLR